MSVRGGLLAFMNHAEFFSLPNQFEFCWIQDIYGGGRYRGRGRKGLRNWLASNAL